MLLAVEKSTFKIILVKFYCVKTWDKPPRQKITVKTRTWLWNYSKLQRKLRLNFALQLQKYLICLAKWTVGDSQADTARFWSFTRYLVVAPFHAREPISNVSCSFIKLYSHFRLHPRLPPFYLKPPCWPLNEPQSARWNFSTRLTSIKPHRWVVLLSRFVSSSLKHQPGEALSIANN